MQDGPLAGNQPLVFRAGTTWKLAYQRNNKSKEQKNLRCFPNCCAGFGHQEGFCGQSISVVFDALAAAPGVDPSSLVAVGEFRESQLPSHPIGSEITLAGINNHGTKEDAGRACYMRGHVLPLSKVPREALLPDGAQVRDGRHFLFEFNRNLKGWHYGFHGCKKTRNNHHVFQVYVLARVPGQPAGVPELEERFRVLACARSPHFQMYCRRRKYTQVGAEDGGQMLLERSAPAMLHQVNHEEDGTQQRKRASDGDSDGSDSVPHMVRAHKRRPQAIAIPPRVTRRRGSTAGIDVSAMNLQQQAEDMHHHQQHFASAGFAGPLATLGSPAAAQRGDARYEMLVSVVDLLDLPRPLAPRKFSISGRDKERFAQRVVALVAHSRELMGVWPPRLPLNAHEFVSKLRASGPEAAATAGATLSEEERFAAFLAVSERFRAEVLRFGDRHLGPSSSEGGPDSYTVSVFALKLLSSQLSELVSATQGSDAEAEDAAAESQVPDRQAGALSSSEGAPPPPPMPQWSFSMANNSDNNSGAGGPSAADFLDGALTPRGGLNMEDLDVLQGSFMTPRTMFALQQQQQQITFAQQYAHAFSSQSVPPHLLFKMAAAAPPPPPQQQQQHFLSWSLPSFHRTSSPGGQPPPPQPFQQHHFGSFTGLTPRNNNNSDSLFMGSSLYSSAPTTATTRKNEEGAPPAPILEA